MVLHGDEVSKDMDLRSTKTSSWVVKLLTVMLENKWGMTVAERDDDGGEEEDEKAANLIEVYHSIDVMPMCLTLMSKGIDPMLQVI